MGKVYALGRFQKLRGLFLWSFRQQEVFRKLVNLNIYIACLEIENYYYSLLKIENILSYPRKDMKNIIQVRKLLLISDY